ncbi:hypothetical protein Trydic_g9479 [Trypoxylus dichotomus]
MKNKELADVVDDTNVLEEEYEPVKKKPKTFSIKEFRKNLKSENILDVLGTFQELLVKILLALLEKRGLLTSVVKGLIHDDADIICMTIDTLRNQILENPLVSKTVKMRTFNTAVIKDVVQLYNWKGPVSLQKGPKKKNEDIVVTQVDPVLKVKVSDCVHQFLLTLCTSFKYGVIFRDPQIGLGRKMQNNLIYTVIDSLDSPWKHSYASELVIKICGACPDLAKTVWTNLKPSLEPRRTEQWLVALKFMKNLVKELGPSRIENCIKELTPQQLAQITQMLVAPTQILKILLEGETFSDKYLKYHTSHILTRCIELVELYLKSAEAILTSENYSTYKNLIQAHLDRNFPNSTLLLTNYKAKDELVDDYNFLDVIFQLLSMYQKVCPQLLDFTSPSINFKKILDYTKKISQDKSGILEIKIVKLYLDQDPVAFLPNTQLFEQILPFILHCYCKLHDDASYRVLEKIFLNTGIFQWCEAEISIWITSLTNIEKCTDSIIQLFTNTLSLVFEKSTLYFTELSEIKASLSGSKKSMDLKEILESIAMENDTKIIRKYSLIKHTYMLCKILMPEKRTCESFSTRWNL